MSRSCIYQGKVMHHRWRPKKHRFTYNIASWLIDLDELPQLDRNLRFFSWNRRNLFTVRNSDYGDGTGRDLKAQVCDLLEQNNLGTPEKVRLLCYPRILGYTFNPLSVYFCFAADGSHLAVVYEVSNTFGERHSYVIPCGDNTDGIIRQTVAKRLHVSPLMSMDCHYRFRLRSPGRSVSLGISLHDSEGSLFSAVFTGTRQPMNDRQLLRQLLVLPFMTIKVIAAIHWEALRLWLKGLKIYRHKPAARLYQTSRGEPLALQQGTESKA
ncbi:MAG: DUF1365 domain-containing protein [Endozoicomonas sp.]